MIGLRKIPLRPPGETVRLNIEKLTEEFETYVFTIGAVGVSGLVVTLTRQKESGSQEEAA